MECITNCRRMVLSKKVDAGKCGSASVMMIVGAALLMAGSAQAGVIYSTTDTFESGSTLPTGWNITGSSSAYTLTWATDNSYSGMHSLKETVPAGSTFAWVGFKKYFDLTGLVSGGETCTVSMRMAGTAGNADMGFLVFAYDSSNNQLTSKTQVVGLWNTTYNWTPETAILTLPANTTKIAVQTFVQVPSAANGTTAVAWYDDMNIQVTSVPEAASLSLMLLGGAGLLWRRRG